MPRPKKITIPFHETDIYNSVIDLLKANPELSDYDFSSIKIHVTLLKKSHPRIKDLEIILERIERYVSINGDKTVGKKELCRIMKISRPTLDKWIDNGFIVMTSKTAEFGYWELYNLNHVIKQLRTIYNKK